MMKNELNDKIIVMLVENQYQDLEVWYPALRLREEGVKVIIAGTGSAKVYNGKFGYPIETDCILTDISPAEVDGVIVPGGWAPDFLRRYDFVNNFVKELDKKGMLVAAICHGPSVLVSAGILKGRTITCFKAIKDDVMCAGAKYVDQEVVVDDNLITARKPEDLAAFCSKILEYLKKSPGKKG
jgi:protease I